MLKIGDKVTHDLYGDGEVVYVSVLVPFVEIVLDKGFTDSEGRERNMVIVPRDEIKINDENNK
jgi:hypothetical protein